jgi:uncharacterized membrane protein
MQLNDPIMTMNPALENESRPYSRPTIWLVLGLAGLIIGLWLLGTPSGVQGKADAVGYAICHRIPSRSLQINGRPLPLCARCTGIYLGVMTGLAVYAASGRLRSSRLPGIKILAVLLLFAAAIGIDGLNSYLSLFEAYHPVYHPNNTLRLITGVYAGLAMITFVLPVFTAAVWRAPRDESPLHGLKELAALSLIAALVIVVVLLKLPALLLIFGLVSAAGVVLMFGIVGCVMFLMLTRRDNSLNRWRDLLLPALVGLVFAIVVIGGIDLLRYAFTGTWDGFTMLG